MNLLLNHQWVLVWYCVNSIVYYVYFYQAKSAEKAILKPIDFVIVPESVHKLKSKYNVPNFKITGKLDSLVCSISNPFTGEVY